MQTSPGWYPDPDRHPADPVRTLRYWDGKAWTDRRRLQPVLTNLELRGLVSPVTQERRAIERPPRTIAELPAPTPTPTPTPAPTPAPAPAPAATASGELGSSTHEAVADRTAPTPPAAEPAPKAGGDHSPPPDPPTGGDGTGGSPDDGSGSRLRRRKWWFLAGVAVLGALAVGLAGRALKPAYGPRVLTDARFVQLADDECTNTLAKLRPPDSGPLGSAQSPAQAAAQIDTAATGLDDLANRLGALPAAEADKAHIAAWLDGWHGFAHVGHTYADYLRQYGANQKKPPAVLDSGAQLAKVADNFALANGLKSCTFAVVPLMDPSTM